MTRLRNALTAVFRWLTNWRNIVAVGFAIAVGLLSILVVDTFTSRTKALEALVEVERGQQVVHTELAKANLALAESKTEIGELRAAVKALTEQILREGGQPIVVVEGPREPHGPPEQP